ncbi:aminopeptidase P family protein [Rickettsia endosymbiont of Polydrusus tereticollis]|uniref:aminopeptidase P family protein n=1 Tax=Rickettsia endosymbiont of Polydrusus tereticollis TaxID=3066251 RepID=UPI0031335140
MINKHIESLRKLFIELGINGYVIPSNDKYMSEYVPEYAKRLEYITGFTGSNGLAVICEDTALFFTDGRYLEQSARELDLSIFQIFDLKDIYLFPWESYIKENAIIGYDPELFTYPLKSRLFGSLKSPLHKISGNLVDQIWENQPQEPVSKVYLHDIAFAGISHKAKIEKCRKVLTENSADTIIITDASSICWLLNLRASDVAYSPLMFSLVILTHSQLYLFINPARVGKEIIAVRPEITILPENEFENILLKDSQKILVDDSFLSIHIVDLIVGKEVKKTLDPCQLLKACKNAIEIRHAVNFHISDAVALCEFFAELEGINNLHELTEYDLAEKLTNYRSSQGGYISDSFPTICGFKENSAVIHYRADQKHAKKIAGDGILLIDSGGQYQGCTTDITRTIAIGVPTSEQKKRYTQVLKGHIALANAKFPKDKITGSNLDILARQYLWQDHLDYPHGTGHGVGSFLSVHEGPQSINLRNQIILQPGMILSNEPGYYIPGEFGIRIENLMYVKENNNWLEFETLTLVPYAKELVEFSILNIDEINYIKQYYQKIKSKIYSLLSTKTKIWLDKQIKFFLE